MKIKDYNTYQIVLGDIQFAAGIVLSNNGENKAAKQVIEFLKTSCHSMDEVNIVERARKELESVLLQTVKEKSSNLIKVFLEYLWVNQVFKRTTDSRVSSRQVKCSLKEIVKVIDLNQLYEQVQVLLFTVPSNQLIHSYMFTPLYFEDFKISVNQILAKKANGVRALQIGLSDSDYQAVLNDFSHRILKYSCNDSYSPVTGNPDAFLSGDPLRRWYVSDPAYHFKEIIHSRDQDAVITKSGSGNTTGLDLIGIHDKVNHSSIDFLQVCTEIKEASKLLFSHNGETYYDIFSHAKDAKVQAKISSFRKHEISFFKGMIFAYKNSTLELLDEHVQNKFSARKEIANLMNDAFKNGISVDDLKPLYGSLIQKTLAIAQSNNKNGRCLFNTAGATVRSSLSNGEKFNKLVNGYSALYSLIDFINSSDNKTGVTVSSFPTIIFRDERYLKRFKTFENYVKNVKVVKEYIDEVDYAADSSRRESEAYGIYNNDTVFDIISTRDIKFSKLLNSFGNKPFSFFREAVDVTMHSDVNSGVFTNLQLFAFDLTTSNKGYSEEYRQNKLEKYTSNYGLGFSKLFDMSSVFCNAAIKLNNLMKTGETEKLHDLQKHYYGFSRYFFAIEYLELLKSVMTAEGNSIVDLQSGSFIVKGNTVFEMMDHLNALADSFEVKAANTEDEKAKASYHELSVKLRKSIHLRSITLCFIYNLFFGDSTQDFNVPLTREQVHDIFYVGEIMRSYFDKLTEIAVEITSRELKKDLYLVLVSLATKRKVLQLPRRIQKASEVSFLYDSTCKSYTYPEIIEEPSKEVVMLYTKKTVNSNNLLVQAFNNLFSKTKEEQEMFSMISDCIKEQVKIQETGMIYKNDESAELLKEANSEIMQMTKTTEETVLMRNQLELIAQSFNEYGCACYGSKMIVTTNGSKEEYYHESGYVICINVNLRLRDIRNLKREDLLTIKQKYGIY